MVRLFIKVPAVKRSQMGIGFFLRLEGVMTKSRELKFKHGKRSDMWWSRFMSRHTLFKPRSQEETASVRHDAMQVNA